MPVRRGKDGRWRYREMVQAPDGTSERISGSAPRHDNSKAAAQRALLAHIERVQNPGATPKPKEVPTFDESGFKGYKVAFWAGIMAPAGTPKAIVDKLDAAISDAVKAPEVIARFEKTGVDSMNLGPDAFGARLQADRAVWGKLIEQSGLKPQ